MTYWRASKVPILPHSFTEKQDQVGGWKLTHTFLR
jgi:hypothetical protein